MAPFSIYLKLIGASVQSQMEYKFNFLLSMFALIWFYLGQIGVILVILNRFETINGWRLEEMAFLYSLLVFSQAITTFFFAALNGFESYVIQGELDRLLLRPLSPLGQILTSAFDLNSVAHLIIGATALYYGSVKANIEWTLTSSLFFVVVILGAALIHGGIRLAVAAVAFWTMRNRALLQILVFSSKELLLYPISIFNYWVQLFLTLVFPIAFINFYPSHYFLNKDTSELLFHPAIQYMTPIVGIALFSLALVAWKTGVNRYQSVGN